jgi:hypothetical protein
VNLFRLHLIESGASISNRNRIMTGVKFLLRVTLEPHDLTSKVDRIKELPSGSRGPVDISVRQQRHLAFIHRPRTNKLNGHNQCA